MGGKKRAFYLGLDHLLVCRLCHRERVRGSVWMTGGKLAALVHERGRVEGLNVLEGVDLDGIEVRLAGEGSA